MTTASHPARRAPRAGVEPTITTKAMQGKPLPGRDVWLSESFGRGHGTFEGRITPRGERLFYFRYSGNGHRGRVCIGRFAPSGDGAATFTVAQARDEARKLSSTYRSGVKDLGAHCKAQETARNEAARLEVERLRTERAAIEAREQAQRDAAARRLTVEQLFDRWAATDLQPHQRADGHRSGRKDGGEYIKAQLKRRVFPVIGTKAAADVSRADVLHILDLAKAGGKLRTANVLLAALKQMMAYAADRGYIDKDPTARLSKQRHGGGKETPRERVLSAAEIRALSDALPNAGLTERAQCAVWIILATGCRVGELLSAEWRNVDLLGSTWYLPTTKNGRDHTIHLSALAVGQFQTLLSLRPKDRNGAPSAWVFPDRSVTEPLDHKTLTKQLTDRQRTAKGLRGRTLHTSALALTGGRWTPHDLRRTAATMMAELGISGDVIDECLNHVIESRIRRTYIRDRRLSDQARAFDALGARLTAIRDGVDTGRTNVVPMKAAA